MKKIVYLIAVLFTSSIGFSQEYRKYWKEGALTWEDFQGSPTEHYLNHLSYALTYNSDSKIINGVKYSGVFSNAYIDKGLSFVHSNLRDDWNLQYHQVVFNLIELNKRRLQRRFFEIASNDRYNNLLGDSKRQLERKIFDFQEASKKGINKDVTKEWLTKTEKDLDATKNYEIPDYKRSSWTYGGYLGLEYCMYGQEYKEFFNTTIGLALGFEFSYKKIYFASNISLTTSTLKKDIYHHDTHIEEKATIGLMNASLGYPLYENDNLRLIPFIGYGVTFLNEPRSDDRPKSADKKGIASGATFLGLNFDRKRRKQVNFRQSFLDIREEGFHFIRGRVFLSHSNFNSNLKGYTINIGLSYGIEGRLLSRKKTVKSF